MTRIILTLLALLLPSRLAAAPTHITPHLVAESMTPAAGSQVMLAFAMKPEPQWHGYWQNPGDAGLPTRIAWTAPKGLRFGPLHYPVPNTLLIAGLMNYVYESDYAELVTLDVPAGLALGSRLPIIAKLDWLACNPQTCVPETATLSITLTVGDGKIAPDVGARFDGWRAALPKPLGAPARYQVTNGRLRLEIPLPAAAPAENPYFFPLTDGAIDYAAPQTSTREGDRLVIETVARPAPPAQIEGVVKIGSSMGLSLTASAGRVEPAPALSRGGGAGSFWVALAGAILGGLLLNIMP